MNTLVRLVLVLGLALSISCSRGGGGGDDEGGGGTNPNGNLGKGQGAGGSAIGQWEGNGFTLVITQNTLALVAQCQSGQIIQAQSKTTITGNTITIQENKKADGGGDCNINLTKGSVIKYSVNGNTLTASVDGQQLTFTRTGGGNDGQGNGGNQGGGATTLTFFESANCGGRKFVFTKGMDCTRLAGSPVASVSANNQCQDFGGQMDAGELCQQINNANNRQ